MSRLDNLDRQIPILIVDDFSTMRRLVKSALRQLGFENVTEEEDGKTALQKLDRNDFKLIISDWNMPNMMGIDLLRAVRADQRTAKIPFLMVTAESKKDNMLEAAKAGVSNYIVKPFTQDVLERKFEAIFRSLNPHK